METLFPLCLRAVTALITVVHSFNVSAVFPGIFLVITRRLEHAEFLLFAMSREASVCYNLKKFNE